jgi:hypothetical protein
MGLCTIRRIECSYGNSGIIQEAVYPFYFLSHEEMETSGISYNLLYRY